MPLSLIFLISPVYDENVFTILWSVLELRYNIQSYQTSLKSSLLWDKLYPRIIFFFRIFSTIFVIKNSNTLVHSLRSNRIQKFGLQIFRFGFVLHNIGLVTRKSAKANGLKSAKSFSGMFYVNILIAWSQNYRTQQGINRNIYGKFPPTQGYILCILIISPPPPPLFRFIFFPNK